MDFSIQFQIDTCIKPRSAAGCNRLYNKNKGATYFLIDTTHLTLLHRIIIHVNRIFLSDSSYPQPRVVHSTSKCPNMKFIISQCLTYILTYGKKLPKYARDKYFKRICTLLIQQHTAASNRVKDDKRRNTRTNTFFRFSFKKVLFYFGMYYPCHCSLPAPFVMSNNRFACHLHHRSLVFYEKIRGCYREDLPVAERRAIGRLKLQKPKISSLHLGDKHQKRIVSYRTGLSFTKDFCWYRHEFYKSNFHHKRLPNVNIKQDKRFKRHEKKYDSQTDYQLTIKHKCLNSGGP